MIMDWLEPKIVDRLREVMDICEKENKNSFEKFSDNIEHLMNNVPSELHENLLLLESLTWKKCL